MKLKLPLCTPLAPTSGSTSGSMQVAQARLPAGDAWVPCWYSVVGRAGATLCNRPRAVTLGTQSSNLESGLELPGTLRGWTAASSEAWGGPNARRF